MAAVQHVPRPARRRARSDLWTARCSQAEAASPEPEPEPASEDEDELEPLLLSALLLSEERSLSEEPPESPSEELRSPEEPEPPEAREEEDA